MLLRSSSAPIPSSLLPHSKESSSSPEAELILHLLRSVSGPRQKFSETEHLQSPSKKISVPRISNVLKNQQQNTIKVKESDHHEVKELQQRKFYKKAETTPSVGEVLFSSSGLDMKVVDDDDDEEGENKLQTLVMGGGGMGSDGGRICGGFSGGSGRGSDGGHGNNHGWENSHGRDGTDAYYQNMIQANPNNALLLGNYAKFLKEVIIPSVS